jgi:hypothetical protein
VTSLLGSTLSNMELQDFMKEADKVSFFNIKSVQRYEDE